MSAFQVSPNHIGAIVRWYLENARYLGSQDEREPAKLMALLAAECNKSVRYRYSDADELPGYAGRTGRAPAVCDPQLDRYQQLTPVQVIKAVDCLEYQSCEHPTWETSAACRLLTRIRSEAIGQLPGYAEAEWHIGDAAIKAVR